MKRNIKASLIILGVASIICAALGILYNMSTLWANLSGAFQKLTKKENLLYFNQSFYAMSAICVTFYLLLLFCGIYFLKLQIKFVSLFITILICEVIYFFSLGFIGWNLKGISHSIAAASGIANGGLMAQFVILFPLWGTILALWARNSIQNAKDEIKTI